MNKWDKKADALAPLLGGLDAMVALAATMEMDVLPVKSLVEIQKARDEVRGLQCSYRSASINHEI